MPRLESAGREACRVRWCLPVSCRNWGQLGAGFSRHPAGRPFLRVVTRASMGSFSFGVNVYARPRLLTFLSIDGTL